MITKEEAIARFKHSLAVKAKMIENAESRLSKWQEELNTAGHIAIG